MPEAIILPILPFGFFALTNSFSITISFDPFLCGFHVGC